MAIDEGWGDDLCHLQTETRRLGYRYREQAHSYRDRIPSEEMQSTVGASLLAKGPSAALKI
jgi:hypothetical protein